MCQNQLLSEIFSSHNWLKFNRLIRFLYVIRAAFFFWRIYFWTKVGLFWFFIVNSSRLSIFDICCQLSPHRLERKNTGLEQVAKNLGASSKVLRPYLAYSQIWLNLSLPVWRHHKLVDKLKHWLAVIFLDKWWVSFRMAKLGFFWFEFNGKI